MVISISLDRDYADLLERLARRSGSKSQAIRRLLDRYAEEEVQREMEETYKAYYSDPENVRLHRELTEEMLRLTVLPPEYYKKGRRHGRS